MFTSELFTRDGKAHWNRKKNNLMNGSHEYIYTSLDVLWKKKKKKM